MKDTLDERQDWTDTMVYSIRQVDRKKIKVRTGNRACKQKEKMLEGKRKWKSEG